MKPFKTTTVKHALEIGPRRFVEEYLFPAMRREHGNGFAMTSWHTDVDREGIYEGLFDNLTNRKVPSCGSVMCIGGTMESILGTRSEAILSDVLGFPDAGALFYDWTISAGPWKGLVRAFKQAKTPAAKERIAEKAVLAAIRMGERERRKS